ncbi:MAG: GAF domain-containing protein [Bacteroidia bacterium]
MPLKELERLEAVNRFLNLEFNKEKEIQEIVELAAKICNTPAALVTLIGEDIQYVKFKIGTNLKTTPRHESFCRYTIEQKDVLVISDTLKDKRFVDNPMVNSAQGIRFYAGSPLTTQDGHNLGSLCVLDLVPRRLTVSQQEMLQILSKQVIHLLEFETSLLILKEQYISAKSTEIKLRSFFESSSSCHLLIGTNFEVLAYNKAHADFVMNTFGIKFKTGMKVTDYIHKNYIADFSTNYFKALAGHSIQFERKLEYPDKTVWWDLCFDPARNQEGEIIGVSYNSTDITKRKEQEEKLLEQNESLRKIAFIQSHELRRPVASIMGLMNVIKLYNKDKDIKELHLMGEAVAELDAKISMVMDSMINVSENNYNTESVHTTDSV